MFFAKFIACFATFCLVGNLMSLMTPSFFKIILASYTASFILHEIMNEGYR
jgi:hypothetical protein